MVYFVATPIGNLKDITLRSLDVLNEVDIIACEDTRNSLKLLNHYKISKKLIAYHKFNERDSANGIVSLAKCGKNIAVISDAGMPLISDPGQILVERLKEEDIPFTIIGGISASLCALALSGLDSSRFLFFGFLPEKKQIETLKPFVSIPASMIFYISPHSLIKDLNVLFKVFGKRKVCLVKEISKINERAITFYLGDEFESEIKGEYVLVMDGAKEIENDLNALSLAEHIEFYINQGDDKKNALKKVAKDRGVSKSEIYNKDLNNFTE